MALVQHIDFILGLNQIIRLLPDNQINCIKLSLGVQEDGKIVMVANGVKWDGKDMLVLSGGSGEPTCPVPPDCKNNPECIGRVANFVDANVNVGNSLSLL